MRYELTSCSDGDSYCVDKIEAASGSSSSETCDGKSSTCTSVCQVRASQAAPTAFLVNESCCFQRELKMVNDIGCCAGSMLAAIPPAEKKEAESAAKLCSQSLPKPCEL